MCIMYFDLYPTYLILPILLIPLLSSLTSGFGRLRGSIKGPQLAAVFLSVTAFLSFLLSYNVLLQAKTYAVTLGVWLSADSLLLDWSFVIDPPAAVMLVVVTTISAVVHIYSLSYMADDPHLSRFMSYLSLFTFFMLLLVSSPHFVGLFLGWEGIGLCSYLLIGFWFTRVQANKAALKAMIVNRVSDFAFTLGMSTLFFMMQTLDFSVIVATASFWSDHIFVFCGVTLPLLTMATCLLFVGAMGKSAQIGLHTWLPDAMEGPTPVSALIHAATLVTAGIFLIIRCSALFAHSPETLLFIGLIGGATAFFAATAGLVQNDIKRVIAYSTCSQLGYMAFTCGLSHYVLSLFHLANHAFFKALLFLSAGAVIHGLSNEQDMRRYGGLAPLFPLSYVLLGIGSLALMGFPFLTGFYSKDLILEVAAGGYDRLSVYVRWLGRIAAYFTAYYSARLVLLTFGGSSWFWEETNNTPRPVLLHAHEMPAKMALPLLVLMLGSIFLGFFSKELFVGLGVTTWGGAVEAPFSSADARLTGEFLSPWIKNIPFFATYAGVRTCYVWYIDPDESWENQYYWGFESIYRFLSSKWHFDIVYNTFVNIFVLRFAYTWVFNLLDKGLLELFGPDTAGRFNIWLGHYITGFQTGRVSFYALFLFFGLVTVIVFI